MKEWKLKNVLLILLSTLLASCGTVTIKNNEWCGDFGVGGASCFHQQGNQPVQRLSKEEWDKKRFGWLCTSPTSFADMKATILKLCKAYKKCQYDQTAQTVSFYNGEEYTVVTLFNDVEEFNIEVKNLRSKLP